MIPVGFGASGSYSITNSVRLNGTSDYLSKTLTTSATTSGSVWVKRSKLGATSPIFDNKVYFTSGDALYAFGLTSTALYRDPSAWYHIFWNGTGVYVNGTLVTGTGTYTAASVTNPRLGFDGTNYFSGYMSDFAFWNGSSASLQGGISDSNGVWSAKRPSAGYSFLAFGSSGALGTDTSGNGNNWTVNCSQTVDTPTNNYCTWNAVRLSGNSVSDGNLKATMASSVAGTKGVKGTIAIASSGKYYWEITCTSIGSQATIGVVDVSATDTDIGYTAGNNCVLYSASALKYVNNTNAAYGVTYATGAVIGVALDLGAQTITFYKNNSSQGTISLPSSSAYYTPCVNNENLQADVTTANFGATAFAYTPPTGFQALCTANLSSVAVTASGTFTGNASADGPFVWTNGNPATLTINGNAVTFGTHADKTAGGFKLRSSSASYNTSGSNTWTATAGKRFVYSATSINTAQGNP